MPTSSRTIAALAFLLVAGIFAGAQLGKLAPLVAWYRDTVGISLVLFGWLTAAIGVFVAFAALPAGFVVDRAGPVRTFVGASLLLVLGGIGVALLPTPATILAARLVEGVGYLFLVVVIPALLADIAPPNLKAPVLAVWGGFVPIGFAASDFLARVLLPVAPPQAYLLAISLVFAAFAAPAALLLAGVGRMPAVAADVPEPGSSAFARSFSRPVIQVALAFGLFVILSIGFFTFLPAYAIAVGPDLAIAPGIVALMTPVGNLFTGWIMRGRGLRLAAGLAAIGFLAGGAAALPLYVGSGMLSVTAGAVVFAFALGVVASALFAALPFIVPAGGSTAVAIGLVAQAGGIATLVGPPLAGAMIERGWAVFGWMLLVVALAGLAASAPLMKRRPAT